MAYTTDIEIFEDDQFYTATTNDYVFDKPESIFLSGTDISYADLLLRDAVINELRLQRDTFTVFDVLNEIQTNK